MKWFKTSNGINWQKRNKDMNTICVYCKPIQAEVTKAEAEILKQGVKITNHGACNDCTNNPN